ncbi:hypothetical protein PCASD_02478 [Puccinia coronata f. sp. avenae]|uniref:Uncharacterized protein n=1 Tax=Puccinia coronata f. sp. avenae TaxID=200324 RepID=A0A2N5VMC3_9BASI|nr:hypothetical protein PCASD_02478 [Puccinia coronata f. sp. avenae]
MGTCRSSVHPHDPSAIDDKLKPTSFNLHNIITHPAASHWTCHVCAFSQALPSGPSDLQPSPSLSAGQGQAGTAAKEEHDAPAQGPKRKKIKTRRNGSHRSTSNRVSSSSERPSAPSGRAPGSSQRASGPSKGASGSSKRASVEAASGSSKRASGKGVSGLSDQMPGPSELPQHSHPSALQTDAQQSPSANLLKRRAQKNTDHGGPAEITLAITFEQISAAREAFSRCTFEIPPLLSHQKTFLTVCRTRPETRNQAPSPRPYTSEQDQLSLETQPSSETQPGYLLNSGKQPNLLAPHILAQDNRSDFVLDSPLRPSQRDQPFCQREASSKLSKPSEPHGVCQAAPRLSSGILHNGNCKNNNPFCSVNRLHFKLEKIRSITSQNQTVVDSSWDQRHLILHVAPNSDDAILPVDKSTAFAVDEVNPRPPSRDQ